MTITHLHWQTTCDPDPQTLDSLRAGLVAANVARSSIADARALAVFVHDAGQQLVAGCEARLWGGCLEIYRLWVHADWRGQGLGAQLLAEAERTAQAQGGRTVLLDTFSFQAPEFYPRYGYTLLGTVDGYPDGILKYIFIKHLSAPEPAQP